MSEELVLRDYQVEGVEFLLSRRRAILADEMGIGKTAQALEALRVARTEYDPDAATLILCPKISISVWLTEIKRWYQSDCVPTVVTGTPAKRAELWNQGEHIWITTYDSAIRDQKSGVLPLRWDVIICDEAHRVRNRKTKAYTPLMTTLARRCDYLFMLTGTPVRGCGANLWTLLHLINPKTFSSYWRFANTFAWVTKTQWGRTVEGVKNTSQLKDLLKQYMLRRTKKKVLKELPPKIRQYIDVEPTDEQRELYDDLVDDMIAELSEGGILIAPTILAQITRLRQILTCPAVLDEAADRGAAINAVVEHITDNRPDAFVIFTPFAQAVPHIRAAVKGLINFEKTSQFYGEIVGGMKPEDVTLAETCFRAQGGCIVATIKAAQSYNLERGEVAYFIGAEWTVDENIQAEDRLHRGTTTHPVNVYYFRHRDTVEDRVFDALNRKQEVLNAILKDPKSWLQGESHDDD